MFSGFNDRLAVGWSVAVSLLEKNYIKGCIMKRITDFYIKHAELIGALYCAVPVVLWFVATLVFFRFRGVYVLRLILSIVIGCPLAAYFNRHGLEMWLAKHRGNTGPATVTDGMLNGAAVGMGLAVLPALTSLIGTNHLEMAKTFIIVVYVFSAVAGGIIGALIASIGIKYIERNPGHIK
jgi:uncharacterized membrane protein